MLRLARRHRLTYIARCDASLPETEEARKYLGDHGIEPILVDHPVPYKAGPAFYGRLASNLLFSPLPYSVASHQSELMRRAVKDYAAKHAVDIWQFEWLPYMDTLPSTPCPASSNGTARRVVMAHNVEALIWKRYHAAAKGLARRIFLERQWRRMERYEQTHYRQASWVVAVSKEDARVIRDDFGMPRVDVVDNGIDREFYANGQCRVSDTREANRILFLGALDWRPNLDALDVLLDRILPGVQSEEPSTRLCVVGRRPPAVLTQRLQATPGAELHADVPDVRPFLDQSGVMVVPLRIGGGSRLKILEALARGVPVVSTTVGAEGLCVEPGLHYVQADSAAEMANALVQAIRSPGPMREMAAKGRQLVLERYDWDVLAGKLEQVWEKCMLST
jgi:glycosyltransferase involved in cell wall biosynthesis